MAGTLTPMRDYLQTLQKLLQDLPDEEVNRAIEALRTAYHGGRQLFTMGNGGSAATASHIANDFAKCIPPVGGRPIRAMALTDSVPLMLSWANDEAYSVIFTEQLKNWIQPNDVVIGLSGSGNSENVVRAIELANEVGAITIGLSGYTGGKLKGVSQISIHVPIMNMQLAEDAHMVLCHLLFVGLRDGWGE